MANDFTLFQADKLDQLAEGSFSYVLKKEAFWLDVFDYDKQDVEFLSKVNQACLGLSRSMFET